jgi:hypothetical protein
LLKVIGYGTKGGMRDEFLTRKSILISLAAGLACSWQVCASSDFPVFFFQSSPASEVYFAKTPHLTAKLDAGGITFEIPGSKLKVEFIGSRRRRPGARFD